MLYLKNIQLFLLIHLWSIHSIQETKTYDDVIKWKHFPRYCPFVRGIHPWPVNSSHKGQWRGAFMFSLICAWINGWVNNREAGDLWRHYAYYDVIVLSHVLVLQNSFRSKTVARALFTRKRKYHHDHLYLNCHEWIPLTKGQWCGTLMTSLILNAMPLIWRHCNGRHKYYASGI